MAELISSSIPNLINGVSQQPPSLRLPTQAEHQLNGLSSVVNGLSKRPNTDFIKRIGNSGTMDNAFIHTMQRDANEFYILVIHGNVPRVFDADGVERTVNYPSSSALGYLQGITNHANEISATTVNDFTFIVNKSKTTAMSSNYSVTRNPEALVYLKKGDYGTDYNINVTKGGVTYTASYETMNSHQDTDAATRQAEDSVQTDYIITQLRNDYISSAIPNVTVTEYSNNILHFQSTDGSEFDIETNDSNGNTQLLSFKDTVADFKTLPPTGPTGFKIAVIGDNSKGQDDYYVALTKPDTNSKQVWKETIKDGVRTDFLDDTMPHQLISNADGTFTYQPTAWDSRTVGDDDTNPFPSFIGKKLNDIFFHQNRLGVLSGENVIMSENGSYFNFFTKTVLTTLDSGPIDVAVSNNQVSVLKHAVPFDNTLLLFSDLNQFALEGDIVLTNETVSINITTQFEADLTSKPVGSGKNVYFATSRNAFAGIREYFVDADVETNDANSITAHVPTLIKGSITDLAASSNEDMLLAKGSVDNDIVYVYSYYFQGTEKLQSAWSKWRMSGTVRNFHFTKSDIYFVIEDTTGIYIEKLSLNDQPSGANAVSSANKHFIPLIDRKIEVTSADFVGTTFTPQYTNSEIIVIGSDGTQQTVAEFDTAHNQLPTGTSYWYGIPYRFEYTFSEIVMKQGEMPITTGRLQLRNMTLNFSDTGTFDVDVTQKGRTGRTTNFVASTLDSSSSALNNIALSTDTFKFGIIGNAEQVTITLTSNSFIPCTFQSAEWEGVFTNRNRRI